MHAQAQDHAHSHRTKDCGIEYRVYFALVFVISLPTALLRMAIPRAGSRRQFFVTEAWSMAKAVTPRIFSA